MTLAHNIATQESAATTSALEAEARALAEAQRDLQRAARLVPHFFEPPPVARAVERARKHFGSTSAGDGTFEKAAEWFLDNYYLIRRVARQVEELPRSFVRHLPLLASGSAKGRPRIDALARALVVKSALSLDLTVLRRFIDAYQEVAPLTIAEL